MMFELMITTEEIERVIKEYYKNTYDINLEEVSIDNKTQDGLHESVVSKTTIKVNFKRNILGKEQLVEQELDQETIREILAVGLNKDGLELKSMTYDEGINNDWKLSPKNEEYQLTESYFNGIKISFSNQNREKNF